MHYCISKPSLLFKRTIKVSLGLLIVLSSALNAQFVTEQRSPENYYKNVEWIDSTLAEGVVWKRALIENFYEAPQSFNAIIIDRTKSNLIPQIGYKYLTFAKTSELTEEVNGLVGINASFYSAETRKPVSWTVANGRLQAHTKQGVKDHFENGAIRFNNLRDLFIITPPPTGWYLVKPDSNVLAAGPLMMIEGEDVDYPMDSEFVTKRHPRSALGILEDGNILLFTADGRNKMADGLSIPELHSILKVMGCISAINLDGGGSTTITVRKQDSVHVVNYPSDNKKFDHKGERSVINALIFAPPPPVYVEVDSLYIKHN
jgi:exopolysaccharide biosynthesis protein